MIHTCSECGYSSPKWLGRCPECGSWGTLQEETLIPSGGTTKAAGAVLSPATPTTQAQPITAIARAATRTLTTGIAELDRVLGSGVVPGSVVLMAGEPGVGKSTLLLEVASKWAGESGTNVGTRKALYVTAEESAAQVRGRAERTGALKDTLYLVAESNLDVVMGHVNQVKPSLLIVDSVQTMHAPGVEGVAGGVAQSLSLIHI